MSGFLGLFGWAVIFQIYNHKFEARLSWGLGLRSSGSKIRARSTRLSSDTCRAFLSRRTNLQNVETGEDVFVFEESHHLQFPKNSLRADEALKDVGQLLEGDALPVARVRHRPHDPEGTVTDRTIRLVVAIARRRAWKKGEEGFSIKRSLTFTRNSWDQ